MTASALVSDPSAIWREMPTSAIPSTLLATNELKLAVSRSTRVLDIGCGAGHLAGQVERPPNHHWFGVDVNPDAVRTANERNIQGAEFCVVDVLRAENLANGFDLIIFNAVLTCMPSREHRAQLLRRALGGRSVTGTTIYIADFLQTLDEPAHLNRYEDGRSLGLEWGSFPVREAGAIVYIAHHLSLREFNETVAIAGLKTVSLRTSAGKTRSGKRVSTFVAVAQ